MKQEIKRGLWVLMLLLMTTLVGCDSVPVVETRPIEPPQVPASLVISNSSQSLNGVARLMSETDEEKEINMAKNSFSNCYNFTTLIAYGTDYFAAKINEVIMIEESVSGYTLVNDFDVSEEEKFEFVNNNTIVDVLYETNIESEFNSFDVKYILKSGDKIDSIIYKNLSGTKVYYVDQIQVPGVEVPYPFEYVYDATTSVKKGYLIIHQELDGVPYKFFINIEELDDERKVKIIMLDLDEQYPHIVNFALIENRATENASGAIMLYFGGTEAYDWQVSDPGLVLNKMQLDENGEPNFMGIFDVGGVCELSLVSKFDEIYQKGFPTKEEVLAYYNNHPVTYEDIYQVNINKTNLSSSGQSLFEIIESN